MDEILARPSYPTGSIDFLRRLRDARTSSEFPEAIVKLNVAVVGAGLGGLSAAIALSRSGHIVTVYEAGETLTEVGAALACAPNSTKHLFRWGVGKHLDGLITESETLNTRRWEDGRLLGVFRLKDVSRPNFGAPYFHIHRADIHNAMAQTAREYGATIRCASRVKTFDFEMPLLKLEGGEVIHPDFIVAADGVNSVARAQFAGAPDQIGSLTGFATYRATLPADKLKHIPELYELINHPAQQFWVGPERHITAFPVLRESGHVFNVALTHPEPRDPSEWRNEDHEKAMNEHFKGWNPVIQELLKVIKKPTKWPIRVCDSMSNLSTPSGRSVIIGDAAHAMVPWMAQGASMAVEDAAALDELLRLITSKDDLPKAMKIFESVRIPRTQKMQESSLLNGYLFHLPDGPEQRARDEASKAEVEGKPYLASSQQWSDPSTQRWAYGYDACEEIRYAWQHVHNGYKPSLRALLQPEFFK